jgi:hypothetical protein
MYIKFNHVHLGYVCQERVKQYECHGSDHYTQLTKMFIGGHLRSKLHVLLHDCDVLGVKGTQVCVLKQSNEVRFWSLLGGKYSSALEMNVIPEILSNLSYQTLEWHLVNQKVSQLLVSPDLSKLPYKEMWKLFFELEFDTVCLLLTHIHVRLTATMPRRYRWGFLMPPAADGNAFLAAFVANVALHGAFPPIDLLAIC